MSSKAMRGFLLIAVFCVLMGGTTLAKTPIFSNADLPPLLRFANGRPVVTSKDWQKRREEIRDLMCRYYIGTFPSKPPKLLKAEVQQEDPVDFGRKRRVKLTFDTPNKASFQVEVWIPSGDGPFPVLLIAPRYYQMGWTETAVRRGYMVCLYPGVDNNHQESSYPGYESAWTAFRSEYPEATWSEIAIKAWLAGRVLDYLLSPTSGYKTAEGQVGIIGHSRYGKQSLIAAAIDTRITAVAARSPGLPASCSYRFSGRSGFNEAPGDWPGDWFIKSLASYLGREHELPIDANGWFGLIAPRRCLLHTAYNDDCDPTFGVERTYRDAKTVYRLLGHEENLRLDYRPGGHNDPDGIINTASQNRNLDWFDLAFNRGKVTESQFPEQLLHNFNWTKWKSGLTQADLTVSFKSAQASADPADKRARIRWSLGQPTRSAAKWTGTGEFYTDAESQNLLHDYGKVEDVVRTPIMFGSGVKGNVYYKSGAREPLPVVIWLHPYSYPTGYGEAYGMQNSSVYYRLASHGYLVLAYDQVGFGSRLLEGSEFYKNHPKWSRLGRMVTDVSAVVDFLTSGKGKAKSGLPQLRLDRIYLLGYSLGGTVGLYATALDSRIAGVASFCGFTPMRSDNDSRPTGGIRSLWEWHGLQPLLGLFNGRESQIPYDYDDVLALVAPRPCLLYTPTRDRMADIKDVTACVSSARTAWQAKGAEAKLTHQSPDDVNRFQEIQQQAFIVWLDEILKKE